MRPLVGRPVSTTPQIFASRNLYGRELGRVFERKIRKSFGSQTISLPLGNRHFFCPNSLKSQMSKKSRVVKTYGRHKHRTVKAQIWLSPDENVHSPFGNGFPSKIEASSSKNVFKPKSSKWWDTSLLFLVKTASFYRGEMRTLIGTNRCMTFSELYRPMVFCQVEFCDKTTFPS